jgi:ABC-type multidrug transport system permease subunit
MNQNFFWYCRIVGHLLHADFLNLKKEFFNKCIDLLIWVSLTVGAAGFLVASEFNVSGNMGAFFLGGCLASAGLFEVYSRVFLLVNDFESEQTIFYYLNLPIPSWLYIIKNIIYYSLNSALMGLPIIPIGKCILWNQLDLSIVCWWKLLIIYCLSSVLYATMALLFASIVPNIKSMENLWMRIIFPLWFTGGYNNSWQTTFNLSPWLGYIALCNPITYIMEGTRIALLNKQGPISFLECALATTGFIVVSIIWSIIQLKKRLDWV